MAEAPSVGARLPLEVTAVAQGGACVARHAGQVVFVRHTLPGERVLAVITEVRRGYCRADAVEILTPSPQRVSPPCPHAGPGRCGGCDWQHVSAAAQRELKAEVVREQFARLAGLDVRAQLQEVEELPGGLLAWRTRIRYAVDASGQPGLHRHRSEEIEPIERCWIGAPGVGDAAALRTTWPGCAAVEVARGSDGPPAVLSTRAAQRRARVVSGPTQLRHRVGAHEFTVGAGGFWQVHPAALPAITSAVLDAVRPRSGERVLDLYAGAGPLTAVLAEAVGPTGAVLGVESSAAAVRDAAVNLAGYPWAQVRRGRVAPRLLAGLGAPFEVVVLDPPRIGTGRANMQALLALRPRAVCYVSCDPATLARDVAAARELGWCVTRLRAFDAFPMTHHVECIALLQPSGESD